MAEVMSRFDQPEERSAPWDRPDDEDAYREGDTMPDDLTGLTIEEAALLLGMPQPVEIDLLTLVNTYVPLLMKHRDNWRAMAMDRGAQLDRIAAILRRFYGEPHSLSSIAPLLALAEELNPDLKER
jgi:hypothetical protein